MITPAAQEIASLIQKAGSSLTSEDSYHIQLTLRNSFNQKLATVAAGFKSGDLVEFTSKGQNIAGIVLDINRKTVSIKETGGLARRWRVSPTLLRAYVPKVDVVGSKF